MHTRSWLHKHAYVETEKQKVGWGLENDIVFFLLASYGKASMACRGTGGAAN